MCQQNDREFGAFITRLIRKENLSREESKTAFYTILKNETTEMQQGAFLAALSAKQETEDETAGGWEAIYELDTVKVSVDQEHPVVENSGTGMDTFKTFNISTAASLIAAADGVRMARHGARALTSACGTVDMAEMLGVDVECGADLVAGSINKAGIGLFNGMSPEIHPMALGRILSNIYFGSTLNTAASLANPAMPRLGVRGVYAKERIMPVANVMKAIGYKRALVYFGAIENSNYGMDEASVCGTTYFAELKENGEIVEFSCAPAELGLKTHNPDELSPNRDLRREAVDFTSLLQGKVNGARADAAVLNAGLIFYISAKAESLKEGIAKASGILLEGLAFQTLERWVAAQNRDPEKGKLTLETLTQAR